MDYHVSEWMSWEGGVDLAARYNDKEGSLIFIHVAAMVHTPIGSAPGGMVLLQESPDEAPALMGFISTDARIADYFGPNIFAGSPFESAPGLEAAIEVTHDDDSCSADVTIADTRIQLSMTGLGETKRATREPNNEAPFVQQILERSAGSVSLVINDEKQNISVIPNGERGEPSAAFTPAGIYSR